MFEGENITRQAIVQRVAKGIVRTFQITEILPDLTVFENIRVGVETAARLNAKAWIGRSERILVRPARRGADRDRRSQRQGRPRRWANWRTATSAWSRSRSRSAVKPRLLLLDEPTAGMGDTRPSTWST